MDRQSTKEIQMRIHIWRDAQPHWGNVNEKSKDLSTTSHWDSMIVFRYNLKHLKQSFKLFMHS